jgi:hypothetical protein
MSNLVLRTHKSYPARIHDNIQQQIENIVSETSRIDAKVSLANNVSITPISPSPFPIPFDNIIVDNNNIYNLGTNSFVIPRDGEYILSCTVLCDSFVVNPPGDVHVEMIITAFPSQITLNADDFLLSAAGLSTEKSISIYYEGIFNAGDSIQFTIRITRFGATINYDILGTSGSTYSFPTIASVREVLDQI